MAVLFWRGKTYTIVPAKNPAWQCESCYFDPHPMCPNIYGDDSAHTDRCADSGDLYGYALVPQDPEELAKFTARLLNPETDED